LIFCLSWITSLVCLLESDFLEGCVCFPKTGFRETTFQTFLFLFGIKKVVQRKTLSNQRKIWLGFQESVFLLCYVCFPESGFPSKLFCVYLPLEKLVNGKHFPIKGKFGLVSRKVFSWKIWAENTFWKLWKFKNIILFVDYIKFDPQTFNCLYIYIYFNIYFSISSLKN